MQATTTNKIPKVITFMMRNILKIRRNPKKARTILERAGIGKNMKVLDYGCGIGRHSLEAAKLVGEKGKVIAADISPRMLLDLKKYMEKERLGNIEPLLVNSVSDIKEEDFDLILLIDVLHFLQDKREAVNSLSTKLSVKGRLLIKFEHIPQDEINGLLAKCKTVNNIQLMKKYWLLEYQ